MVRKEIKRGDFIFVLEDKSNTILCEICKKPLGYLHEGGGMDFREATMQEGDGNYIHSFHADCQRKRQAELREYARKIGFLVDTDDYETIIRKDEARKIASKRAELEGKK